MELISIAFVIFQGLFAWFATGFDDAINFASVLVHAKSKAEKIHVIVGMTASFLVMLSISLLFGEAIVRFSEGYFMGISIRKILVVFAALIVVSMGVKGYIEATKGEDSTINDSAEEMADTEEKKHFNEAKLLHAILPALAVKIFLLYQVNSSDDIITNTSFFIALNHEQLPWFIFGLTLGVLSMMAIIHRYSETLEKYPKYTAILMMISGIFIAVFGLNGIEFRN